MRSRGNIFSTNVILGGSKNPVKIRENNKYGIFESVNNFQTDTDPGFVDFENENFMLKKDSQVYKKLPDFEAIPFDKIGLYIDEYRKVVN